MKTKLVLTGVMLSLIYITCGGGFYRWGGDGHADDLAAAIADFEDWLDEIDGAENCTEKFDIFMIGDTSSSDDVNLEIVDSTSSGCAGPYSDLFTAYSMFIEVGEELENEENLESGEIPDVLCDYIDDFTDAVRELIEEECFGIVTDEDPPNDCVEDCAGIWDGNNICGCTDSTATNYDSTATFDDESCEYPPEKIDGLKGRFRLSNGIPQVKLRWDEPEATDVNDYHIFKANGPDSVFESLASVSYNSLTYEDTNITWLGEFVYKVQAEDSSTNIGEFSDSIFVRCFTASGNWIFPDYDSVSLCIDENTIATPANFEIITADTFATLDDTIGFMIFSESYLDSMLWTGNGWMMYTYSVLELNTLNGEYDTITTNKLPEYYYIDLSDPDSGIISFASGLYDTVWLYHGLTDCNGDSLFP